MAVFFVDPSNGDNANSGASPTEAFATIEGILSDTSATYDNPHVVWIRRGTSQQLSGNVAIDNSGLFAKFVGWPSDGDPMYYERPQAGVDAGWDNDVADKPLIDCNTNFIGTTSDNPANIYAANCSFGMPDGEYKIFNVAGGNLVLENIEADHHGRVLVYWDKTAHDIRFLLKDASLTFRKNNTDTSFFETRDNGGGQYADIELVNVSAHFESQSGAGVSPGRHNDRAKIVMDNVSYEKRAGRAIYVGHGSHRDWIAYAEINIKNSQISCEQLYNIFFHCEATCHIENSSITCDTMVYVSALYSQTDKKRVDLTVNGSSIACNHILSSSSYTWLDMIGTWHIVDSSFECSQSPFHTGEWRWIHFAKDSRFENITIVSPENMSYQCRLDFGDATALFDTLQLAALNNVHNATLLAYNIDIQSVDSDIVLQSFGGIVRNGASKGVLIPYNTDIKGAAGRARAYPLASVSQAALSFTESLSSGAETANGTHFFAKFGDEVVNFSRVFDGTVALSDTKRAGGSKKSLELIADQAENACAVSIPLVDLPAGSSTCKVLLRSDVAIESAHAAITYIADGVLYRYKGIATRLETNCGQWENEEGAFQRYCLRFDIEPVQANGTAEITLLLALENVDAEKRVMIDRNIQWS